MLAKIEPAVIANGSFSVPFCVCRFSKENVNLQKNLIRYTISADDGIH